MAVANGLVSWQPGKVLQQFERDLAFLPLLFADKNDAVVVPHQPSAEFEQIVSWLPGAHATFVPAGWLKDAEYCKQLKVDFLDPWGWSPAMHHQLRHLKGKTLQVFRNLPVYNWEPQHRDFYSRQTALAILKKMVEQSELPFLPPSHLPKVALTIEDVERYMTDWNQIVVKSPWSSSGRGVQILRYGYLNTSNKQWINAVLKTQGYIMVEPLLHRVTDFSLHFHISPETIRYEGVGRFETNTNGQYEANILNPDVSDIQNLVSLEKLSAQLLGALKFFDIQTRYAGYAGVDLMVIRLNGDLLIHPCVEVNWRYNMGIVALQLQRLLADDVKGKFAVHFSPKQPFGDFHQQMTTEYPLEFKDGKPFRGYFPLSDPAKAHAGAYVLIDRS
jgi:hypothetical protein